MEKADKKLLKLGLLNASSYDRESEEWLTYPHRLFQEFLGALHAARKFKGKESKVRFVHLFYTVNRFREVENANLDFFHWCLWNMRCVGFKAQRQLRIFEIQINPRTQKEWRGKGLELDLYNFPYTK